MSIPTVESWLHPSARLARNKGRQQDIARMLRIIEDHARWNGGLGHDLLVLRGELCEEQSRLGEERLDAVRQLLNIQHPRTYRG